PGDGADLGGWLGWPVHRAEAVRLGRVAARAPGRSEGGASRALRGPRAEAGARAPSVSPDRDHLGRHAHALLSARRPPVRNAYSSPATSSARSGVRRGPRVPAANSSSADLLVWAGVYPNSRFSRSLSTTRP